MASTYSSDLRIELIANGEQSGTWGSTTNNNLGTLIEDAISGMVTVTVTSAAQALTALNGAADEARCAAIQVVNGSGANCSIYAPPVTKLYVIKNTSLLYNVTVYANTGPLPPNSTIAAGAGVVIPPDKTVLIRCDATNMVDCVSHLNSLTLNTPLPTPSGGTGFSSYDIGDLLYASSNVALARLASTNTGNVLITNGVNTAPSWGKANLTTAVTGVLPLANGGLGLSNTAPRANSIIIGTGSAYALANLVAGTNVTITSTGGNVTIASTGGGGGGTGNVSGSGTTTDNTLVRWNGTTGTSVQSSGAVLSDTNVLTGVTMAAGVITTGTFNANRIPDILNPTQILEGSSAGGTANPSSTGDIWAFFVSNNLTGPGLVVFNNNASATGGLFISGARNPCNQITFQYSTSATAGSGTATEVGKITTTTTNTAYGTGSDYRLKENVVPLTDAITKLKLLAPKRFSWKAAPEEGLVDGFIAHEVQEVVPTAVIGAKDAVDENGKPITQMMDSSFLIPLLTAALQEAVARIEALEAQLGT